MTNRKIIAALAGALLLTSVSGTAFAKKSAQGSPYDYRIKTVTYNPQDTVLINAVVGLSTHIVVSPGEHYVTHVFGDDGAWAFTHVGNDFFIRPTSADFADTNLVIVTNRRTYNILLHCISNYTTKNADGTTTKHFIHSPWTMRAATVQVTYKYPDEMRRKAAERYSAKRVESELAAAEKAAPKNLSYRMSNESSSREIQPLNVWDDYRFTYFRFPANAPLPTLFVIGPDGKESVTNVSVQGENHNILVAHTVARQWRIRHGQEVVGVVNDGYNPSVGANPSGTASPAVKRVIKVNAGDSQ